MRCQALKRGNEIIDINEPGALRASTNIGTNPCSTFSIAVMLLRADAMIE
jgi:hypothetical protein